MAAFDTSRTTYGSATAVSKIGTFLASLLARFEAARDAAMTRKALLALTDRELEDIGLSRGDVDSVAKSHLIR